MIKRIFDIKGELLGIVVKNSTKRNSEDIFFFTDGNENIEVAQMYRKKGYIKPHSHNLIKKETWGTQEFLYLESGSLTVNFYDCKNGLCDSILLKANDFVILLRGGHGFKLHEDCKLIEVKNGPYLKDRDKTYLKFDTNEV